MATQQNEITNAFEEIASTSSLTPTKIAPYDVFKKKLASFICNTLHRTGLHGFPEEIASTSYSTLTKKAPYDVFINHRGIDVKKTLAASIYNTLHRMGLRVFLDEEVLELGDIIPAEIEDAMRTSFLHIAIFSPNYAQSPWCLAELSFMLKTGTRIIPVFYDVDPSDLRWAAKEKGTYVDAFCEHEAKKRYSPKKLKDWKMALQQVSNRSGHILKKDEDEGMLLKSIVNCVLKDLKKVPLEVARHPVGLQEAVQEFEDVVQDFERHSLESAKNVQIIGIVGMGGSGKTTLAKELYNQKSSSIARCSFLFDVRDAAHKNLLHNKQKTLLEDLKLEHSSFDNVEKGKQILASSLRSLCFLIVLDDVDHPDQLDVLLPVRDSLASSGSLIIVTSREKGVLASWGITCIYNIKLLALDHARELLCWHAFLQKTPPKGFEALLEKFVDVCNGLPLSLKVFGGQLYRKPKAYWQSQLNKISRLLPKDIKETLEISYDTLDEEEKEIFLDIACLFIGEEQSLATAVWDGCGRSGLHSWETLLNKCLVELDEKNCIKMHDQLRDLGREIAMRQSPYRLWLPEQITKIQEQGKERLLIRGISAETTEFHKDSTSPFNMCMELVRSSSREFSLSGQLKLLVVRENYFREEFATVSTGLVWLRWVGFQLRTLPSWLPLKNLSVLELLYAKQLEQLWRDNDEPPSELRELKITGGSSFRSFPRSIGCLKHLKKIVLRPSHRHLYAAPMVRLSCLPEEFCLLQSLEHLTLIKCRKLTSLPRRFGNLTNLRHLDLSFCAQLMTLPVSFKQLIHLEYINLADCSELTFTSENADIVENMTELEMLNFKGCKKLQELPLLTNQRSLRELDVTCMHSLRELPSNIGELSKLEVLTIWSDLLTSLPNSIGNLSSLTHLEIEWCRKLESLPESIGNLSSLTGLTITGCELLVSLPESMGNLSSLTRLTITSCEMVESLPESMGNLNLLQNLRIWWTGIESLPKALAQLSNLQDLSISSCPIKELDFKSGSSSLLYNLKSIRLQKVDVSRISISQQCCPSLETLHLRSNKHLTDIQTLPLSLKSVALIGCKMLKSISGICGLLNLQELVIEDCGKLDELPSFAELVSLETLRAGDTTWKMAAIQSWEHMERLRKVELKLAACDISAIEHCLQTIKKWPSEITWIVCGRTEDDVDSLLNLFTFDIDFSLGDSDSSTNGHVELKSGQRRSCKAAVMLCFIINSFFDEYDIPLFVSKDGMDITSSRMRVGKGKWVWIGVSTYASWLIAEEYSLSTYINADVGGMLLMGKQKRVVEGFYKLLAHLGFTKHLYSG